MKSFSILRAIFPVAVFFASHVQAQILSAQLYVYTPLHGPYTYSPNSNFSAGTADAGNGGDYYVNNWNEVGAPPSLTNPTAPTELGSQRNGADSPLTGGVLAGGLPLYTSTGSLSPIAFSLNYTNADNTGSSNSNFPKPDGSNSYPFYATSGNANSVLAGQGVSAPTLTLNLEGLTPTDSYTIITYVSGLFFTGGTDSVSDGTQTFYYQSTQGGGPTGWVQGTASSSATATAANFIEFDGVTSATGLETITLTGLSGAQPALEGFQVIDTGSLAVPEPSTWAMMLGGLGVLAFYLRRKSARL